MLNFPRMASDERTAGGARIAAFIATCIVGCVLLQPSPIRAQIAVKGDTIFTMAGPRLLDGVVLVRDGRVEAVGPSSSITIPEGYRILEAKWVTPGLVDAHGTVGFSGILNQPHDQDQLEKSDPIQPELRAIDGYNAREELVEWVRDLGVTTVHTGHGPGALISGQTMIVKTDGETVEQALVDSAFALAMTLGSSVSSGFKSPGTRSKGIAMLRKSLVEARNYVDKRQYEEDKHKPGRDLKLETLVALLDGDYVAMITANRAPEILGALRLAREFGFRMILDGGAESYLVLNEIREAGVPVILHPLMARASGERRNMSFETAATLRDAGIPFAIQSGYESYVPKTRVILFEAAIAAAYGLSFEEALSAVTIDAARILEIDERVGSIEPGKDADLVLYDGDPFEYRTHVCTVIIDGQVVSEECR